MLSDGPLTVIIAQSLPENRSANPVVKNLSTGRNSLYQMRGLFGDGDGGARLRRPGANMTNNDIGFAIAAWVETSLKMGQRNRTLSRNWHRCSGLLRDWGWQISCKVPLRKVPLRYRGG
jgi:hypothetical protein